MLILLENLYSKKYIFEKKFQLSKINLKYSSIDTKEYILCLLY